jgi:hypothetical protein
VIGLRRCKTEIAKSLQAAIDRKDEIRRAAFECFGHFNMKKKGRLIGVKISRFEKLNN